MDDTEDDARYPPNPYQPNHHNRSSSPFTASNRPKLPVRNTPFSPQFDRRYRDDEDDDESDGQDDEPNDADRAIDDAEEDEDDDEEEDGGGSGYGRTRPEDEDSSPDSRGKRRKLNKFAMGFEFAPRVAPLPPPPSVPSAHAATSRPPARNNPADWSEDSTFVLLDAWGELYVQNGRKSLRSDEWMEVAKKVNESSKTPRTDGQCRNRLDTLKKKYKKEKAKMAESMSYSSKWVYFKKMEELMVSPSPPHPAAVPAARQQPRLPCGVDSGEYVFTNPRVYVNRSNGAKELGDSPEASELIGDDDDEDDESDGLPPQSAKKGHSGPDSSSFRMLADSIQKFGEIYEKIENSKRQHMAELEKMRRDFHRDLELQKRQILERAQVELAKLRQEEGDEEDEEEEAEEENNDDEEIDGSAENMSS